MANDNSESRVRSGARAKFPQMANAASISEADAKIESFAVRPH